MIFAVKTITVEVPDCPAVAGVAGIPSWVVGWSMAVFVAVVLALVISIAIVRTASNKERASTERKRIDAISNAAGKAKVCPTCATVMDPVKDLAK